MSCLLLELLTPVAVVAILRVGSVSRGGVNVGDVGVGDQAAGIRDHVPGGVIAVVLLIRSIASGRPSAGQPVERDIAKAFRLPDPLLWSTSVVRLPTGRN